MTVRRRAALPMLAVIIALLVPVAPATGAPGDPPPPGDWLAYVNFHRSSAGLPPVSEDPALSDGDRKHARYMVENGVIGHSEDPGNPWYTPEGDQAAQSSNVMVSSTTATIDNQAIDLWMEGPFHALGIVDPGLSEVGFGSYRDPDAPPWRMAAALDVLSGRGAPPPGQAYPVLWPGNGAVVPLNSFSGSEFPDPLTSCPGYQAPTGVPILVQLGADAATQVTGASLSEAATGAPLELCVFDGDDYANPDPGAQSLGRNVLASRGAVVLVPRTPLKLKGTMYNASITVNGQTTAWSFSVRLPDPLIGPASLDFGRLHVGEPSSSQLISFTNQASRNIRLEQVTMAGPASGDFSLAGGSCQSSLTLAPGASCTASVGFTPSQEGDRTASLSFVDEAGSGGQTVPLAGEGFADTFVPVTPARILNTFTGIGVPGGIRLGPGQQIVVDVTAPGSGVPDNATAVVLNMTVTGAEVPLSPSGGLSYLSVTPNGGNTTSNLNFKGANVGGQDIAALVKVPLSTEDDKVRIYNDQGQTHVIADVFGYYVPDETGDRYNPVTPQRVLQPTQVVTGDTIAVDVTDDPAVSAVVLNVTVSGASAPSYLSVTPEGGSDTSNLNFKPVAQGGQDIANLVIVPVGANGNVSIYNNQGAPFVIADVFGYYRNDGGSGFTPLAPTRLLQPTPVGVGQTISLDVTTGVVPSNTTAVVLNVTVSGADVPASPTAGLSYLSVTPGGGNSTSNLNFKDIVPGGGQDIANLVVVPVGGDGNVRIYNDKGNAYVIADVFGFFGPEP
jgi:hypothetical protein